jgi:uncharacterized protein (TIGR02217 family)
MAFFECEFPRQIRFRSMGGPTWKTTINQGLSGQEQRNRDWQDSRGKWQISLVTPARLFDGNMQQYVELLVSFFDAVGGQADGFRLFDHKSHIAKAQPVITYNGNLQLAVSRTIAGRTYQKVITKPITSAIVDYQGNALPDTVFLAGTNSPVAVDPTTGIVTGAGDGTLLDFEYHFPVRFNRDDLPIVVEESDVLGGNPIISVDSLELLEVLPPNF